MFIYIVISFQNMTLNRNYTLKATLLKNNFLKSTLLQSKILMVFFVFYGLKSNNKWWF
uniref:Uncharacterized protein n=1 Tax=Lepeophtheirus salmonis TaxID=72036 RepID=A0A0K2URW3_LEPSM